MTINLSSNINVNNLANIPNEMRAYRNWFVWRLEDRGGVKPSKIPYCPRGGAGKVNDPITWGTYDEALQAYQSGNYDGIGFVFTNTPFVGIDIDNCYDENGTLSESANQAFNIAQSYTEVSQSGSGLHIIMKGTLTLGDRRNTATGFEMYGHGSPRYFAMTGNTGGNPLPIREDQAAIDEIHARFVAKSEPVSAALAGTDDNDDVQNAVAKDGVPDEDYLAVGLTRDELLISLNNGKRPHGNESSDDMALMNKLGYWCNGNQALMKQAFLNSSHYIQKDAAHKQKCQREDYLRDTIKEAIGSLRSTARIDDTAYRAQNGDSDSFDGFECDDSYASTLFEPLMLFEPPSASTNPSFPTEVLPDLLKCVTEAVSESLQVAQDMVAVALLTILSLCIQKRFKVEPHTGWTESVNLYALIIARPSDRKSPVLAWLMKYLHQYVSEQNELLRPQVEKYKMKCDLFRKRIESYKRAFAENKKINGLAVPTEAEIGRLVDQLSELEKNPVNYLTLTVSDTTMEALAVDMAANGEKMGIISDEGGMFQILSGLYSGGAANIDVALNAFNGGVVQINRKGSKNIAMQNPALTILLLIQPTVLADVMCNRQFSGRGLLARFLYSTPQSIVGKRKYNTVPVPPALESEYKELIYRLLHLASTGETSTITYTPEAQDEAERFHNDLEPTLRDGYSPALEEWGGKLEGKVARIAALLHIALHVEQAADVPISGETFAQARKIGDYFIAHAQTTYQSMGATEDEVTHDAKYIWKRITEADVDEISKRDLYQICSRSRFPKTVDMQSGLDVLIERGYIAIRKEIPSHNHQNYQKVGRPTETVYINPLLAGGDASGKPVVEPEPECSNDDLVGRASS